jgi:redox-sensitive bicupin YhaK (pirin superfamily)
MLKQSQAQIFKSDQRGSEETPLFKRLSTFSYGSYRDSNKSSFGCLRFFNDETLLAGATMIVQSEEDLAVVLLPLMGSLGIGHELNAQEMIPPEQVKFFTAQKGMFYKIVNPAANEINYLHFAFSQKGGSSGLSVEPMRVNLKHMNSLTSLGFEDHLGNEFYAGVGVYAGRAGSVYSLKEKSSGIFVYIINGAFEVNGRLAEHRDGLSFWNAGEIEYEALVENSILLLIELPLYITSP